MVENHGYAIKFQAPIEGIEAKVVAQGWLMTEEWARLDGWVRTRSSQSIDKTCHIDGEGTKRLSPMEIDALRQLARRLYDRLQPK